MSDVGGHPADLQSLAHQVILVGPQPPPLHGMAAVNAAVRERLQTLGVRATVIDLAARSLDRSWRVRIGRLPKVAKGLWRLLRMRPSPAGVVYMSVSGGLGQVYELLFLAAANLRGLRCFLHHHNYAYLDRSRWLTRLLVAVAGPSATHIALSRGMAALIQRHYPRVLRVTTVSNAALLPEANNGIPIPKTSLTTLGFLGNIATEKGIFEFLNVAAAVQRAGYPIEAKLAGPFQDSETERRVHSRLEQLGNTQYVGPKYGDAKAAFFRDIDVLLFPTRYVNEAEPLTIHEAMMHGVPVIACGRGAISEIVANGCGLVVDSGIDFVGAAVRQLIVWRDAPAELVKASLAARSRFRELHHQATEHLEALLQDLSGIHRSQV